MKKQAILKIVLLAMPLLVVLIASSPTGVTVFDGKTVTNATWMQAIPESTLGWCAPVAALLNYVLFALAVIYALFGKNFCVNGIFILSLIAVCIAVLPIVIQSEPKIIPNAFGAIFLGIQCIAARIAQKDSAGIGKTPAEGIRLERH